jgi:hypothetical protein
MRNQARADCVLLQFPRVRTQVQTPPNIPVQHCGDEFWKALGDSMYGHFRKAEFTSGILHGIRNAGELLARHFPRQPDDVNELPGDIAHD